MDSQTWEYSNLYHKRRNKIDKDEKFVLLE